MKTHQLKRLFVGMAAMAGCVVLTVGGVAPQVLAAQEESGPTEDMQLASTKLALASALAQAGVISRQNAAAIVAAPAEKSRACFVKAKYKRGSLRFKSSQEVYKYMERRGLSKAEMEQEYIEQVAKAIATADMWLRLKGNGKVKTALFLGWEKCVAVSALNLMNKRNISGAQAMQSMEGITIAPFVSWHADKKIFTFKEKEFAELLSTGKAPEVDESIKALWQSKK